MPTNPISFNFHFKGGTLKDLREQLAKKINEIEMQHPYIKAKAEPWLVVKLAKEDDPDWEDWWEEEEDD